jgi:succinate dehydrogenase flavin-adding protein (antitoxin of CptAB toxin-antitoxin module)
MSDIAKKLREFSHLIDSEDPIILQRLQIEIQMEALKQTALMAQMLDTRLDVLTELMKTMDWKLWETVKVVNPLLAGGEVAPVIVEPNHAEVKDEEVKHEVAIEDDEFKIVDGKLVKR